MKITKRGIILGIVLLLTIIATVKVYLDEQQDSLVQVVERKQDSRGTKEVKSSDWRLFSSQENKTVNPEDKLLSVVSRQIENDMAPLFSVPKKPPRRVASASAPVSTSSAPPVAPPLPFKFFGRMRDGSEIILFLSFEERNLVVKSGDVIDDIYHVDSISESSVEFTYIPMKLKQTLPIGGQS